MTCRPQAAVRGDTEPDSLLILGYLAMICQLCPALVTRRTFKMTSIAEWT
jgi:hypothetical protein